MESFKQQCVALRKKDYSLEEIVRATGKPKSSVYYHIRNLPLSDKRLTAVKKARGLQLRKISALRKGISARDFARFNNWDSSTVSLVAHLMFDGGISRTSCVYNNRNEVLLQKVERCMGGMYGYSPSRYINLYTGVSRISYHNVSLAKYMSGKAVELTEAIGYLPTALKREFVRAFFDDEGCMDFRPERNVRQVRGYQKNTQILHLMHGLLDDFGIDSKIQKPNEVVISGKKNLVKFQKEIGFSPGIFINGNRTNSLWKKHLEKRELLDQAIKSYIKA